jgi:hypothetical protein
MKHLVLTFTITCVIGALALYYFGQKIHRTADTPAAGLGPIASNPQPGQISGSEAAEQLAHEVMGKAEPGSPSTSSRQTVGSEVATKGSSNLVFQQLLQTLLSPQASFDQKQGVWQQLKDSGKMDLAITDLEQRAAANPNSAEYPAILGQAYLQKAGMLKDIRAQGILGMKADQSFDVALNLDPANWDAGFWKAAAMSYWPPQLGKGQEVLERLAELIKWQEAQPPQPQFTQTYVLLGEQYQRQGYADYAKQIWQRGVEFFPNNSQLQAKLTQLQPEPAAAR